MEFARAIGILRHLTGKRRSGEQFRGTRWRTTMRVWSISRKLCAYAPSIDERERRARLELACDARHRQTVRAGCQASLRSGKAPRTISSIWMSWRRHLRHELRGAVDDG